MGSRIFVYHSPCMDGYVCAYIAWLYSQETKTSAWDFIGMKPSDPAPDATIFRNKQVIVADICWSRQDMDMYAQYALSFLVLDHHETNQKALEGAPYAKFDMQKSACMMVWDHFFPNKDMPTALYYIGQRDIWKHKNTTAAEQYTAACPNQSAFASFADFHAFIIDPKSFEETVKKGIILLDFQKEMIKQMASKATFHFWKGIPIAVVNAGWPWTSDLGNALCEECTDHVAFIWTKTAGQPFNISLRSHDKVGPNVAMLAVSMGGGGHAHAAAFRMENLPESLFL